MIDNTGQALQQHGNAYEYDVLNRIKTYNEYMFDGNNWTATSEYGASYSYDPNGNLMTLQRQSQGGATIDNFTYQYQPGTNKLITLTDAIGATPETNDIEGAHSYTYDMSGNLTSDIAEDIQNIDWTLDGKVGIVQKTNESIEFAYDATGNRVLKSYDNGTTVTNTYYIRDASSLIMATYTNETEGNPPGGGVPLVANLLPSDVKVKEWPMYGSGAQSRIGTREGRETPYTIDQPVKDVPKMTEVLGQKNYEITDHLGNVRVTFRDVHIEGGKLNITSNVDYYPFGMQKEAETYNQSGYTFGFNGMEKDDEVKGEGNSLDFGARIYDPRVGRWLSRDPLEGNYPSHSSFEFARSSPILFRDPNGKNWEISEVVQSNGDVTVFIKLTASAVNESSTEVDMQKFVESVQVQMKNTYEITYSRWEGEEVLVNYGDGISRTEFKMKPVTVNVVMEIDIDVVESREDVADGNHVIAIQDGLHGEYGHADYIGGMNVYLNSSVVGEMDIEGSDQNTIPHELGHTLGLEHVDEYSHVIMFFGGYDDLDVKFDNDEQKENRFNLMFSGGSPYMDNALSTQLIGIQIEAILQKYGNNELNQEQRKDVYRPSDPQAPEPDFKPSLDLEEEN